MLKGLGMPPNIIVEVETPNPEYAAQMETHTVVNAVSNDVRGAMGFERATTAAPDKSSIEERVLGVEEFTALIDGIEAVNEASPGSSTEGRGEIRDILRELDGADDEIKKILALLEKVDSRTE
ncbi:MAG: hypothetical protein US89_C0015G0021 [Candidatus Peregrinibacteria bacterium GW2011_GWF2_38_29]|nr:MAG: hypothetical protein US89_C0015G0021 [Candidatus Peregrinibacteria bacterium GW2011_GWF2_38_29]HBB02718.1 hypothetical protein [Candidatus Peregrinibacteria bacterium]